MISLTVLNGLDGFGSFIATMFANGAELRGVPWSVYPHPRFEVERNKLHSMASLKYGMALVGAAERIQHRIMACCNERG